MRVNPYHMDVLRDVKSALDSAEGPKVANARFRLAALIDQLERNGLDNERAA